MQVISVNVGLPREVLWKGKTVTTGIFKEPVEGQVMMQTLNLDGVGLFHPRSSPFSRLPLG